MNFAPTSPHVSRYPSKRIQGIVGSTGAAGTADSDARAGGRYSIIHHAAHASPNAPVMKNTHRQPPLAMIAAMSGGAITAPTAVPALIIPIAVARSPTANHSDTAFVTAGNPPPSPIPSSRR